MTNKLMLATCGAAACLLACATETIVDVPVDLSDGHAETINVVSSSETNIYSGPITGSGSILKTGSGVLALANGGNTFTGGITVQGGAVRADAAGAFGTNTITVSAATAQVHFKAGTVVGGKVAYTEFTNNINVTVNSASGSTSTQTIIFYTNTLIRGNITGVGDMILRHNPKVTSPGYGGPSAAIYGTVETPGTIRFNAYGTFEMHGPVKAPTVYGGTSHSGDGTVELYDAGNEIDTYMISHDILSLKAANAIPGALIEWRPCFTGANTGRSKVLLNGNDQTFAGMRYATTGSWALDKDWGKPRYDSGDREAFSSSSPATITLTGIANTRCPSFMKIRDQISLVVDAASAPGFVQEFHYHPNPTSGDIEVRAGTLSITNGATFGGVPSVTVGANGTLLVTASTNTFASATNLVVNGCFVCADDVVTPFAALENLEIGSGATFTLPTGCEIRTVRFKQGDDLKPNGSYSVGGGTVIVSDDIVLTAMTEFAIPVGVTNVLSRRVTGTGGIRKTGLGYLLLSNAGNDFAGGVAIESGTVLVAATNALGTGTVTITANGSATRQLRFIANAEISNPIIQSGQSNATYPSLYFEKDVTTVLKGGFTHNGNTSVFFWNEQKGSSGTFPAPGPKTIFDCPVTISSAQPIWLRTYGEFHFKQAITALSIIGKDGDVMRWSEGGKVFLYSPDNYLNRVNDHSPYVICEADEVLGGNRGRIEFNSSDWYSGIEGFDFKGHSQTIKSLSTVSTTLSILLQAPAAFHAINSSVGAPTLTLVGEDTSRTTYAAINNGISLTMNTTNFPGFAQTFGGKVSNTTGDVSVVCGILKLMKGAGFPNAASVTVGRAGKIVFDATTTDAFKNVPTLTLDGQMEIRENAAQPFADGETDLALSDTATFTIPSGMIMSFKTVTTNGVTVPAGSLLDKSVMPGVISGDGVITAASEGTTAWTGEGAGDSVWTPGNWSDPSVVDRLGLGMVTALFGTGGRAENDRALALYGILFEGNDCTLAGDGAAGTTLAIGGGGIQVAESAVAHTYAITDMSITQTLPGNHVWTIPSNQTVRIKDGIVAQPGTIKVSGTGNLALEGTNTFAGGISMACEGTNMPLLLVSGLLATPDHADQGRPAADDGKSLYFNFSQDIGPYSRRVLCVSNAVIEKPVALGNRIGIPSIWSPNNTTNEFRGQVRFLNTAWHKVSPDGNSEIVFRGGLETAHSFRNFGSGMLRFTDKPSKFNYYAGLNPNVGTVIVETTGNSFANLVVGYENNRTPTVKLAVSGAMTNGNLTVGYNGGYFDTLTDSHANLSSGTYTLDLMNGTTQRCARIAVSARGVITGAYPSMIEVFGSNPMSTAEEQKRCVAGRVEGGVGFHMCGSGTLLLAAGGTYNSTGDLAVSSGTLELASGAVWAHGKKVRVTGTGTLKVNASNAVGGGKAEMFVGDSWMLDIPAGCTLTVHALRDAATGRYLPSGTYGKAGSGAKHTNLAAHFAGDGLLQVRRSCLSISFR